MKKRKSKSKNKAKKSVKRSTKEKSKLEQLKERQSLLFTRVEENIKIILSQTKITREEFDDVVRKYGYDSLDTIEGFAISEPIWDQMLEIFQIYSVISEQVERLKVLESKLLIHDSKKLVEEMEGIVNEYDKEDSFYTELPDKEGIVKMKKKWHMEKEFWENRKRKFEGYLKSPNANRLTEQDKEKMLKELDEATEKLKALAQKRNWARRRNVQPSMGKISRKISQGIASIQGSIGEITKPFAEMGDMSGYSSSKSSKNQYEDMFSSGGNDTNVGKRFENFFDDPPKKKGKQKDGDNYFG